MSEELPLTPSSTEYNEAPLQSLPPGDDLLTPPKCLADMTDEEVQQWHARLRDHQNHNVLMSFLRTGGDVKKATKVNEPAPDISEYS